ncbi:isoprenoid synthase domain-containing protein [Aspergillus desertorum]
MLADTWDCLVTGKADTPLAKYHAEAVERISPYIDEPSRIMFLKELQDYFSMQTAYLGSKIPFEEYKTYKGRQSGARILADVASRLMGLQVSQQEKDSVAYFVDKLNVSASLLNDLYSFHKEFEEHSAKGNMDTITNTMALLMSSYGYTEEEAASILKQEIKMLEQQALEEFRNWNRSNLTRSPGLVGYVFGAVTTAAGINYWTSHSERYFRTDFKTNAEDRAKLVGNSSSGLWRLENYPPPLTMTCASMSAQESNSIHPGNDSSSNITEKAIPSACSPHLSHGDGCPRVGISVTAKYKKADSEKLCMAPYDYISSLPGKRTMARLVDAAQTWFKIPTESSEIIKDSLTILFNSSLMLDDIQDDSVKRRGMPAAHVMYGVGQTVNCVSYSGVKAYRLLEKLKQADACREAIFDELEALFSGQALELYWKFHRQCPSMSDYIVMIDNKTGGFFRLITRLMVAEANLSISENNNLVDFMTLLGRYYQIRDDYQNLVSDEYSTKKGFCDDLSEGKFSIVLIHALENSSTPERIRGLMFGGLTGGMPQEIREYILAEMKAAGSLEYTTCILTELYESLLKILNGLEATMGENKLLRSLIQFLKV